MQSGKFFYNWDNTGISIRHIGKIRRTYQLDSNCLQIRQITVRYLITFVSLTFPLKFSVRNLSYTVRPV